MDLIGSKALSPGKITAAEGGERRLCSQARPMGHLTKQNPTHQNLLWKMTKFFYRRKMFISKV